MNSRSVDSRSGAKNQGGREISTGWTLCRESLVHATLIKGNMYADHGETPGLVICEEGKFRILIEDKDQDSGRRVSSDELVLLPYTSRITQLTSGMGWCYDPADPITGSPAPDLESTLRVSPFPE